MSKETDGKAMLIMKFGGTSVGSIDALKRVIEIVESSRKTWENLVVVVSALSGVTNMLLDGAVQAAKGNRDSYLNAISELSARHTTLAERFLSPGHDREQLKIQINRLITEFSSLCQAIVILGEATPRALDAIAGLGERMSARVLAAALEEKEITAEAVDAFDLIVTDTQFQSAIPDFEKSRPKAIEGLSPLLSRGSVPVVTGFIGATSEGVPTTLGRGGSDYSAAILGTVLSADQVWIWTDVDGVMTADPRIVPEAHAIEELTFREIAELAYFGAKVIHPKTIRPIVDRGITLRVRNTFAPDKPGTRIVLERRTDRPGEIKAITGIRGLHLVTVEGRGMMGVVGVAARTFKAVAETGTSVPLISQASSEQSICFAIPQDASVKVCFALEREFAAEIARKDIDRVWTTEEVVIVTVVGEGMRNTPGVSGRIFSELGAERVNVIAIAQGSSEASISMVLDARDTDAAMRALHRLVAI